MKILIVDALGSERGARRFTRDVIGAGPRMIAGILQKFAIKSQVVTAEQFLETKKNSLDMNGLFVSAMTMDYHAVKRIIRKWGKINQNNQQNTIKILGGPITSAYTTILSKLDFDIAIIGEAEATLSELIQKNILTNSLDFSSLEKIPGITYRSSQKVVNNPVRSFISKNQLNSFQASTQHIKDYPFYRAARIFIECVRGCSNFNRTKIQLPDGRICNNCGTCLAADLTKRLNCPLSIPPGCGYCSVPSLYGPPRSRSISNIIREMKELIDLGVSRLILGASDFLEYQREELTAPFPLTDPRTPPPNYPELENLLVQIAQLIADSDIYISIENIKASLLTEKAAALIASYLPNTTLSIGCETGSKTHSQQLGRPFLPDDVLRAINLTKKYNLRTHVYFIHGLPGQTLQTAIQTSRFMKKLTAAGIDKITVYKFKPLPMSAFEAVSAPPSAPNNKASKIIVDTAIQINQEKKMELVGRIEKVIVCELSKRDTSKAIGYPLRGGPTILIDDATHSLNKIVNVKITKVLSDKLVGGYIIKNQ
jgi:radical SAM superfamily enzyme YgiQ (UPF0313 family)